MICRICCSVLLAIVSTPRGLGFAPLPMQQQQQQQQRQRCKQQKRYKQQLVLQMSSFSVDGSDYSSKDSDFMEDDDFGGGTSRYREGFDDENAKNPIVELQPVPMSKNSGNRFVALVFDKALDTQGRDALDLHYDRIALTEDHVMFCRKSSLYNETFNTEQMVDVLFSRQVLSSDLKRAIGHAYCMESTELKYIYEHMKSEPILQMLTGGDISNVPLYRWRHIRDYSLRIDDGRFGCPCMLVAMDYPPEEVGELRQQLWEEQLEFLIRSEKVIAAGSLHLPTEFKDDEASEMPLGDLIFFNAKNRDEAIEFVESFPNAREGLYENMRVHFYNMLDTTGKFVSEDPLRDAPCAQMQEALEYWGYPVEEEQTPWLNW